MRTFFFTISLLVFTNIFAQNIATINGTISNSPTQELTIMPFIKGEFPEQKISIVDNNFKVKVFIEDITFLKLAFSGKAFLIVIAEPNDEISINVDLSDIINTITIKGSTSSMQVYETEAILVDKEKNIQILSNDYAKLKEKQTSQKELESIKNKIDSIEKSYINYIADFIKQNIDNPASMFFIEKLNIDEHFKLYEDYANKMKQKYPTNAVVEHINAKVVAASSTREGIKVPNIQLPNINGDTLSLYPLKGEITIIDFWASWCSPCRMSNPSKVSAYDKYHKKGLEIYSVSLDQNADGWKTAIIKDNLKWENHVSELKGWQSKVARQFGISSIPANIIIDKEGKIIAKNLRGEELHRFLERFFGE